MDEVCAEYERFIKFTLGDPSPDSSHLRFLHGLGYLPLEIRAVPEGTLVPLRVPMLTIENTVPECFWVTNFIETLFSCEQWICCTSATIALEYRKILDGWAKTTGADPDFVAFQGHDFSMRGMTSLQSAAKSGAGHLLSFDGTDTIPAIAFLEYFYGANIEEELVGTSIPATEHSVMCAYGEDEIESFTRIIHDVYPGGLVSIVSDTWDLWHVLTKILPSLKNEIMARDGRVVIRPDSGDPVDIITGATHSYSPPHAVDTPEQKGVVELLWDTFGGTVNEKGYKVLDPHVGTIYGDSITMERAEAICDRLAQKGFASSNIVLGIGSYTYQHVTRDTFGFALKSTWCMINGVERAIYKDPVTDLNHMKKSLTGKVVVQRDKQGELMVVDHLTDDQWVELVNDGHDVMEPVFRDGLLLREESYERISGRVQAAAV